MQLANKGLKKALKDDPALMKGLNSYDGKITYKAVAEAIDGLEFVSPESVIS